MIVVRAHSTLFLKNNDFVIIYYLISKIIADSYLTKLCVFTLRLVNLWWWWILVGALISGCRPVNPQVACSIVNYVLIGLLLCFNRSFICFNRYILAVKLLFLFSNHLVVLAWIICLITGFCCSLCICTKTKCVNCGMYQDMWKQTGDELERHFFRLRVIYFLTNKQYNTILN